MSNTRIDIFTDPVVHALLCDDLRAGRVILECTQEGMIFTPIGGEVTVFDLFPTDQTRKASDGENP